MLEIRDLEAAYGDVPALSGVTLRVGAGEIVALLGPNGAGKSTTVKILTGLLPLTHGASDNGVELDPKYGELGFAAAFGRAGYDTALIGKPAGQDLFGWVATVPELDVKLILGRHCYHHAWHAELWHKRLPELRELLTRLE